MVSPSVSVVIPVKNEVANIRACLEGILAQTVPINEIIVIDSGSTDGTLDILKEYASVKTICIPPEEFNHGETRNLGVRETQGEYVILTVGDARPANEHWAQELLNGFEDEEVAGVCGQQVIPHEHDKNPADWFRPQSKPGQTRYQFASPQEFKRLRPSRQRSICSWDDVTAMYRRDVLLKYPFPRAAFAEDALWARRVLLKGYAIVYNKRARAYHYHHHSYRYAYDRTLAAKYHSYKQFGKIPDKQAFILPYLKKVYTLFKEPSITWGERVKWSFHNFKALLGAYQAHRALRKALQQGNSYVEDLCGQYRKEAPITDKNLADTT